MDEPLFDEEFGNRSFDTVQQGESCLRRLRELGSGIDRVQHALRAGDQAARQADEFSPKTAAGLQRWTNTIQELRRGLATDGWECEDPKNSPRLVRADKAVSLAVVTGDKHTGVPEHFPKNAHPLGSTMVDAIRHNDSKQVAGQQPIEVVDSFAKGILELNSITWVLLYRRTAKFGLRAEISYPALTRDRVITDWKERLILPEEKFIEENTPLDADTDDVYFEIREA